MATFLVKTSEDADRYGPFDGSTMKALAETGVIRPDHLVSKDGAVWVPAAKVKGLNFAESDRTGADVEAELAAAEQGDGASASRKKGASRKKSPAAPATGLIIQKAVTWGVVAVVLLTIWWLVSSAVGGVSLHAASQELENGKMQDGLRMLSDLSGPEAERMLAHVLLRKEHADSNACRLVSWKRNGDDPLDADGMKLESFDGLELTTSKCAWGRGNGGMVFPSSTWVRFELANTGEEPVRVSPDRFMLRGAGVHWARNLVGNDEKAVVTLKPGEKASGALHFGLDEGGPEELSFFDGERLTAVPLEANDLTDNYRRTNNGVPGGRGASIYPVDKPFQKARIDQ